MSQGYIGRTVSRLDAPAKVLGEAVYPGDLFRPGMLYARLLLANRPKALIKKIDPGPALALPGVTAVLTAADVPNNVCGLIIPDQPVLCGQFVHHAGDKVALVVAESQAVADEALRHIRVDYEELAAVTDPEQALEPDAPLVHAGRDSNLILENRFGQGDIEAGFAQAEVIVENTYQTGWQEHAFLAPEAGLAYIDPAGRVTVETAGQWAHDDRRQIATALDLPEEQVRVIYRAIGGAFGGREDVSVQIVLALAAYKLGRPAYMAWSRQESLAAHHKRHPIRFKARLGATRQGKLVAASVDVLADGGAYISTSMPVLANAMVFCLGPYQIPHTRVTGQVVYTNNPPAGAMRGFGALQANFCAEMQMARLAAALDMDPVELRARNLIDQQATFPNGAPLPPGTAGAAKTVDEAARQAGWEQVKGSWQRAAAAKPASGRRVRGRGFAAGWKNVGLGNGVPDVAETIIELQGGVEIERVIVRNASAEVGQGVQTVLAQIAAEALGVALDRIEFAGMDTAVSPQAGTASASRLTVMAGNAVLEAAGAALAAWAERTRPAVGHGRYEAPPTVPVDIVLAEQSLHYSMGYTAGSAEVEVDLDTGEVTLLSFISALDAGRAINPQQVEGQAHGGLTQAIGWTLLEKLIVSEGRLVTTDLATYLLPTALDVPDKFRCTIIETPDAHGPFGARGIGELPMLTAAPAILAAIHDATGVWLDHVPIRAEEVWLALERRQAG